MEISSAKDYTLITSTEANFSDFFDAFMAKNLDTVGNHKIIQISEKINTTIQNLLLFLNIANNHRSNGASFVIICTGIDIDEIPDELNVVPTMVEAEDVLEMEAIERDLGF